MFEDAVVVGAHPGPPGLARDEEVIEEGTAAGGVAFDQGEVFGGEEDCAQSAEDVAGAGEGRLVEARAVGAAGGELEFDEGFAAVAADRGADHGLVGAESHQRLVGRDAVTAEGGDVTNGLDEVGLALAVETHDRGDAGLQRNVDRGIRAEVDELKVTDMHPTIMPCGAHARDGGHRGS